MRKGVESSQSCLLEDVINIAIFRSISSVLTVLAQDRPSPSQSEPIQTHWKQNGANDLQNLIRIAIRHFDFRSRVGLVDGSEMLPKGILKYKTEDGWS